MKNKYLIGLLVIMCFILTGCGKKSDEITLNNIAKKFNENESVKEYKQYEYELSASVDEDTLVISTKNNGTLFSTKFNLDGNILSNDGLTNDELMIATILIDSIGQLQGYKSGELLDNLYAFPNEFDKYSVSKEGFELKVGDEFTKIKFDLSKKIPLLDMNDFYLKADQFEVIKKILKDNSTGNETGKVSKIVYDLVIGDEVNYICFGEKDKLTNSTYKSILSALEVMYGTDVVNKFKSMYPEFKDGKTELDGFTIETNYTMEDQDETIFKGMKTVLVSIDNSIIK